MNLIVCTYNCLNNKYFKSHIFSSSDDIEIERKELQRKKFDSILLNPLSPIPSVLCMQEVDSELASWLQPYFSRLGLRTESTLCLRGVE